jgi:hypothetical protein
LPIKNVSIKIGEQTTTSDDKGYYKIENLDYGSNKAVINATDYETLSSDVTLSRGENPDRNFTLKQVTYSYIEGILLSNRESIDPASLKLTVGDKAITVNADKTFKSEQLTGGKVVLSLTSSIYRDTKLEVNLIAGKNIVNDLSLAPAKDFNVNVSDFISEDKIEGVKLAGGNLSLTTNKDGVALVSDLDDGAKLDIKLTKSGFLDKTYSIQNTGTDLSLTLVPAGKIAYTSNRDGRMNLYSSNFDGSEEKKLTDGKGSIERYSIKDNVIYFTSDRDNIKNVSGYTVSQIYSISINGGTIKKLSDLKGNGLVTGNLFRSESIFLEKGVTVTAVLPEYYQSYDVTSAGELESKVEIVVKKFDGTVLSTIKNLGHGKFYSTESSLYKPYRSVSIYDVDTNTNSVVMVVEHCPDSINNPFNCDRYVQRANPNGTVSEAKANGYVYNVSLSKNGNFVYYVAYDQGSNKPYNVVFSFSNSKIVSVPDNALEGSLISLTDTVSIGMATYDQNRNLYAFDFGNNTFNKITSLNKLEGYFILNPTTLIFTNEQKVYIQKIGKNAKQINISLTPSTWNYGYSYSDGM